MASSPSSTSGLGQAGAYSLGWSPKSRFAPFDEEPSQAAQWLAGGHLHVLLKCEARVWAAIGCLENTKTHRIRTHRRCTEYYVHAAQADPMKHSVRLVPSWQQLFRHQSLGPCRLRGWKSGVCLPEVEGPGGGCGAGDGNPNHAQAAECPLVRVLVVLRAFGGRSELGLFQTAGPFVGLAPARFLSILCPAFVAARSRRDSPSTAFITPRPVTTPAPLDSEASKTSRRLLRGGIPFVPSIQNTANTSNLSKALVPLLDCPCRCTLTAPATPREPSHAILYGDTEYRTLYGVPPVIRKPLALLV